jgi:ATP-dependent DNA helicase RecQ
LWVVLDAQDRPLGRMAKSWSPPEGLTLLFGEIGAIVRWRKSDAGEEFRTHLRRDNWEVVLPELVFADRT